MIAAIYTHVTPRKERERLRADYENHGATRRPTAFSTSVPAYVVRRKPTKSATWRSMRRELGGRIRVNRCRDNGWRTGVGSSSRRRASRSQRVSMMPARMLKTRAASTKSPIVSTARAPEGILTLTRGDGEQEARLDPKR